MWVQRSLRGARAVRPQNFGRSYWSEPVARKFSAAPASATSLDGDNFSGQMIASKVNNLFRRWSLLSRKRNSFEAQLSKKFHLEEVATDETNSIMSYDIQQNDCHTFSSESSVHGGVLATLVTDATLLLLCANDPKSRYAVTTELNMTYMDRAAVGERLKIHSSVIKVGNKLGFAEAKISNWETGAPVATGRHTVR